MWGAVSRSLWASVSCGPASCQLFAYGRGHYHCSQLLPVTANGIFLTFYENTIEFEGFQHPLTGKSNDQTALLCLLDMICCQQMPQEAFILLLGYPVEVVKPQNPVCQCSG